MKKRSSFRGSLGFVLAAAGSAVGLGNIWRFPYLAAKDGGGLFIMVYIVLALSFGFTILTTEVAIGRRTKQSSLTAYTMISKGFGWLGVLAGLVPVIIMPYYCVIGGWVLKYFVIFLTGKGDQAAEEGYFTGFTTGDQQPLVYTVLFLILGAVIVLLGVNKGIEPFSKIIMPALVLLVVGIAVFSLTIRHTTDDGITRTGVQGLKVLFVPDWKGITFKQFFRVLLDAMGQLFFSLSVAMGIMITFGSYMTDETDMAKSINQIEIFDTAIALLAGVMIIPAVFTFMGREGMEKSGPSLMFVSLPHVFKEMGMAGNVIGCLFFAMVFFAALTSAVSIMEAVTASFMDRFSLSRRKAGLIEAAIALAGGICVCLGYNRWYFECKLPTGSKGQLLDIMDYLSNNVLMPLVAIGTCILVGWVVRPQIVIEEIEKNGQEMGRKRLYVVMIRFITPVLLVILFFQSVGLLAI